MKWFIGLMSGTSLDGVDGVLAEAEADGALTTRAHAHVAMPGMLHAELLALNRSGPDELHRAALAANALMGVYADVVTALLRHWAAPPVPITIGAHGQTVRHRPGEIDGTGYTLQLINGALLAERTGIDVVCDFRTRDVAAGGQGAPLVPAFHAARFAHPGRDVAVLNLGGIANLTLLPGGTSGAAGSSSAAVTGFDCGPASVLMDAWCRRHCGAPFDVDGGWAASGQVHAGLLAAMLADPFFGRAPPKSTGRDLFDASWLDALLAAHAALPEADVMATLAELTARGVVDAIQRHAPATTRLLVCGGGAFNGHLMRRMADLLEAGVDVLSSAEAGVPPDQVEALAFAWLAQAFLLRRPGNVPAVTGARGLRVLGALYPAA